MYSEEFLENIKEKLSNEKKRVEEKIDRITQPESSLDNPQWDETANDAIQDVEEEAYLRIYRDLKERVDEALQRIEEGTYGMCTECNKHVPQEALEKEPWAEFCNKICADK